MTQVWASAAAAETRDRAGALGGLSCGGRGRQEAGLGSGYAGTTPAGSRGKSGRTSEDQHQRGQGQGHRD